MPLDIKQLSQEELERFHNATHCEICHEKFESKDRLKCKNLDHDHYTNRYRFASCNMCNLLNRSQSHIPIYFHNFGSYDSKLLLNVINKNSRARVSPKFLFSNLQKLRYLTYNSYKFKDSLEHLPSSLSKLVEELNNPHQNHKFPIFYQSNIIKSFLPNNETSKNINHEIKLLTGGKGIYPCSFFNDANVVKDIEKFSPIECVLMIYLIFLVLQSITNLLVMCTRNFNAETSTNTQFSIITQTHYFLQKS